MSHPLSHLIFENPSFSAKELDTIITTYLRERAEWLKDKVAPWVKKDIDIAFELSEKCECEDPCSGKKIGKPKPSLPSKIPIGTYVGIDENVLCVANKINQLIDYLHSKEAREVE